MKNIYLLALVDEIRKKASSDGILHENGHMGEAVVIASSDIHAREFCHSKARGEESDNYDFAACWLDPARSTCLQIGVAVPTPGHGCGIVLDQPA